MLSCCLRYSHPQNSANSSPGTPCQIQFLANVPGKAGDNVPVLGALLSIWEMQDGVSNTCTQYGPALAIAGIWEMNQQKILSLSFSLLSHYLCVVLSFE